MPRDYEDVKTAPSSFGGRAETESTHPAFGQIRATRVQGGVNLYGSDLTHHGYVVLAITESTLRRGLSSDHYHGDIRPIMEVAMSEAQWATMISSFNMGDGVPCTIQTREKKSVPSIPPPETTTRDLFASEMDGTIGDIQKRLSQIAKQLEGPLSKTKVAQLQSALLNVSDHLSSNVDFVATQFDRHIETTVERAKIEVNAYATGVVMRTGIAALQNAQPVVTLLGSTDE